MKKYVITLLSVLNIAFAFAQAPIGYYYSANGKSSNELRLKLQNIINNHTNITYGGLWSAFQATDVRTDGYVWDMYSNCNFIFVQHQDNGTQGGSECQKYNREHSVPQSWFNGAEDMYADIFHIYPTDKKVNADRGDNPFGEVNNPTYTSANGSKRGNSSFAGYSGIAFEPIDAYKGDFARTYFYMATRYINKNFTSGEGNIVFTFNNSECNLTSYAVNLFLKWHRNDPVSQKEINRNNVIYSDYQHNRNPFIDHPELAEYIWGDSVGYIWQNGGVSAINDIALFMPEISPNPSSEFILVNDNDVFQDFDYHIFTIQGKIILSGKSSVNRQINISNIASGIYFIKISTENTYFIQKIIKTIKN